VKGKPPFSATEPIWYPDCVEGARAHRMPLLAAVFGVSAIACAPPPVAPCSDSARRPAPPPPSDPFPRPVSIYSASETSADRDTVELVVYRDDRSTQHRMELHFTSYPIVPSSLSVDGNDVPRGPAWGQLGRALLQAGLDNNATILLRCFGGDPTARC
jgi:hypothetical protein